MPKILALDTSTDACSVALNLDGHLMEDFRVIPRQHTQQILPMLQSLLAKANIQLADLDAIAFGRGPGSFAGIRIATGVTQGLAYAADIPVLAISTLEALALAAYKQEAAEHIVAALDARMDEIYVAGYDLSNGYPKETMSEQVCAPTAFKPPTEHSLGVGSGWRYWEDMSDAVQAKLQLSENDYYPTALAIVELAAPALTQGKAVTAADALPVYLRDEVAWKKKDQQ